MKELLDDIAVAKANSDELCHRQPHSQSGRDAPSPEHAPKSNKKPDSIAAKASEDAGENGAARRATRRAGRCHPPTEQARASPWRATVKRMPRTADMWTQKASKMQRHVRRPVAKAAVLLAAPFASTAASRHVRAYALSASPRCEIRSPTLL
ncbi:hypothetical protein ERJ75_001068700 [Trypanosoma vivax]|nr:hypothetical protein ERJ75_001068700 [Trypanosoma vivax]